MSYPPPPPGVPQPGYGAPAPLPNHPQTTTILVLGICSLVVCGFLGPVAWIMGNKAIAEIDASNGMIDGRGSINAGRICGIIATALMALGLVFFLFIVVIAFAGTS